jgi:ubiquinone/menaquinone biosynthesis C-methylase UbiE
MSKTRVGRFSAPKKKRENHTLEVAPGKGRVALKAAEDERLVALKGWLARARERASHQMDGYTVLLPLAMLDELEALLDPPLDDEEASET